MAARVFAHRGDNAHAPENTLAAFRLAAESTGWIELDVDVLADDTVIVCHDSTLDRTTSGRGFYDHLTWPEVATLDAGGWFGSAYAGEGIPRLRDVVAVANERGLSLNVELKSPRGGAQAARRLVAGVAHDLAALEPDRGVLISSFNHPLLSCMREAGEWPLACLFDRGALGEDWRTLAELVGASAIHPFVGDVTEAWVSEARGRGFDVNPWTVTSVEQARRLASWGVTGFFADDPALMVAAVQRV